MKFIKWLLLTILVWFILYCWEYSNNSRFFTFPWVQFILCWISLISSMVEVPYGEHRILLLRLFKVEISTLEGGVYFIPFLWLWGEISIPKEFREDKKEHHVHMDTRETRRHREIGLIEDISREHFFPFISGKGLWAFVLTFAISYGININLIPYLKNKTQVVSYVAGFMGYKTQINNQENINSQVVIQSRQNQTPIQHPAEQDMNKYNRVDTAAKYVIDPSIKVDSSTTVVDQNSYQSVEEQVAPIADWLPPNEAYNPTVTWDNLKSNNNWTILVKMTKEMNYVNEYGYFISSSNSYNYFPSVFVDGFRGDQNFFCHFFKVYVRELTFKNGETWRNGTMDFCDYVNIIKSFSGIDNYCYRDVKIYLKDQFKGKYTWRIIDAGYGNGDKNFQIFLYDKSHNYQTIISQNEIARTGRQYREDKSRTPEMDDKYLEKEDNVELKSKINAKTNIKRKKGQPIGSNY